MKLRYLLPALAIGLTPLLTIHAQTPPPPSSDDAGQKPSKPPRDPKEMAQKRVEMMTKTLDLTPDQSSKISAIFEESATAMKALHDDSSLSKEQKWEKMKAQRDEVNSKIAAILTPEQNTKWQEQREKMKQKHEKGGGAASSSPSPAATPN